MAFFKYVSPSLGIRIVEGLKVRFTPPLEFNDPFECMPTMGLLEEPEFQQLVREQTAHSIAQHNLLPSTPPAEIFARISARVRDTSERRKRQFLDDLRNAALTPLRIFCLSEISPTAKESVPMWAHYAREANNGTPHEGVALEFDRDHDWVRNHRFQIGRPYNSGSADYHTSRSTWENLRPQERFQFRKSTAWQHEKEFRLVRFAGSADLRTTPVDSLADFPADLLRSVTLGLLATPETESRVRRALGARSDLGHVQLRRVDFHPDEFEFTAQSISR